MRLFTIAAALLAGLACVPAHAGDRAGLRVETRASYETATFKGRATRGHLAALGSAMAAGGEVGYDLPVARLITVGPYAGFENSTLELCDAGGCIGVRNNFAAGASFNYLRGANQVLYLKVGYARLTLDARLPGRDLVATGDGWQVASGWELRLSRALYARLEGGYADNGHMFAMNFQRFHSTIGVGARF